MGFDTTIDYVTTASTGNSYDFGDVNLSKKDTTGMSSGTYGATFGGYSGYSGTGDDINYVTISSAATSQTWGNILSSTDTGDGGSLSNATRGVGYSASRSGSNVIEYITWASTGDTEDFGDLSRSSYSEGGNTEDTVRVVIWLGGFESPNYGSRTMEYITVASTSNTADFGDVERFVKRVQCFSNGTRGEHWGGYHHDGSSFILNDQIEYITIATLGNSQDQGNLDDGGVGLAGGAGSA